MSQNKVTFGLEKVHIAFFDTAAQTQPAWDAPQHIPGAVRFAPEPQGEENTFYADNGPYFTYTSNDGYNAELEMANVPDDVKAKMLGWITDDNGMLIETTDGEPAEFALMGQVLGDKKNRRFVFYRCKASRPSKENATRAGSVEPNTDKFSLRILPVEMDVNGEMKNVVKGDIELSDTNQTEFNSFFDSVYVPTFGGA